MKATSEKIKSRLREAEASLATLKAAEAVALSAVAEASLEGQTPAALQRALREAHEEVRIADELAVKFEEMLLVAQANERRGAAEKKIDEALLSLETGRRRFLELGAESTKILGRLQNIAEEVQKIEDLATRAIATADPRGESLGYASHTLACPFAPLVRRDMASAKEKLEHNLFELRAVDLKSYREELVSGLDAAEAAVEAARAEETAERLRYERITEDQAALARMGGVIVGSH